MAAAIKALNAKIRSNKYADYFCSTHFWGPASNFGIPLAAIADMSKDPEIISGPMTAALSLYSGTFMRYALAVTPANYLLFGCHAINFTSQLVQGYRYVNYRNLGGKELVVQAREAAKQAEVKVEAAVKSVGK
ncbi:mitochondrial pyruvate carrier 1 [Paraphaeosphaeria minitans]|uniref:Mitochondrial pyruvate carrier n=1 Tax=Paraphaeosphaeria minitans TaxID=565426 RepID=A0A9P6G8P1_9PLEO|nr:mitochondrial pyruvate carrier 1 [Paraphaeosphaeria minitans]